MPEAREVAAALRTRAKLADVSQHQRSRRSTLDTPSGKGTQVDLLPEFKSLKRERPLQRISALTSLKGREPAFHLSHSLPTLLAPIAWRSARRALWYSMVTFLPSNSPANA
jgi:hypothetical protein